MRVENCPLTTPPPEIVAQGTAAILNYFFERESGTVDRLYEAKMLILGEGGSGKTSLLRRLYQPDLPLPEEQETTKGIAIHRHEFPLPNGRTFRMNVWDFGGQEIYHATHKFFLTHRSLYLLLDDTRKDHKTVSDPGFKDWLDIIELFGGDSPVLIFQNEKGGRGKQIDLDGIRERYRNVLKSYSGNLELRNGADALRQAIETCISNLPHIVEELPTSWIKVRQEIELVAATRPHITLQDYFTIYERHLAANRVKALLLSRYLHDLGVFLHFQDDKRLARLVILQNQWATEAVYRILDDESIKQAMGRFTDADCSRLWQDSDYADLHPELLALMEHFELCYRLPDRQPDTWLAPQLLAAAKPLPLRDWHKAGDLVLRYHYQIMPKGIISRMIVRLHRFLPDPTLASVACVQFQQNDTILLAELAPDGRAIELRARGPEHKALLAVVAADLDAINYGFQGLRGRVDKLIPCDCAQCNASKTPHMYQEEMLNRRKRDGKLHIECPLSYQPDVDVLALLDGVRLAQLPRWAQPFAKPGQDEELTDALPAAPAPATQQPPTADQPTPKLRPFKIFLASSAELRQDRDEFERYFRQLNDRYIGHGIYLQITRWENFLDAMSSVGLQEEYNRAVRTSDVFVSLFATKTGKFTEQEFDAAFGQFKTSNRPYVYTYFRDTDIKAASARRDDLNSLWQFQDKLKAMGHYPTDYDGVEHLKRHFRDQLDQLLEMVPLESSRDDGVPTSQQPAKRWWQTLLGYFR